MQHFLPGDWFALFRRMAGEVKFLPGDQFALFQRMAGEVKNQSPTPPRITLRVFQSSATFLAAAERSSGVL